MRMLTRLVLLAALACVAAGCSDKQDNSKTQTPNAQPVGAPKKAGSEDRERVKGRSAPIPPP